MRVVWGQGDAWGIPWGHRVGLMSLLMIHKAYIQIFLACGWAGCGDHRYLTKLYVVSALVYLCTVGALWGNRPYTKPTPQHICLIL